MQYQAFAFANDKPSEDAAASSPEGAPLMGHSTGGTGQASPAGFYDQRQQELMAAQGSGSQPLPFEAWLRLQQMGASGQVPFSDDALGAGASLPFDTQRLLQERDMQQQQLAAQQQQLEAFQAHWMQWMQMMHDQHLQMQQHNVSDLASQQQEGPAGAPPRNRRRRKAAVAQNVLSDVQSPEAAANTVATAEPEGKSANEACTDTPLPPDPHQADAAASPSPDVASLAPPPQPAPSYGDGYTVEEPAGSKGKQIYKSVMGKLLGWARPGHAREEQQKDAEGDVAPSSPVIGEKVIDFLKKRQQAMAMEATRPSLASATSPPGRPLADDPEEEDVTSGSPRALADDNRRRQQEGSESSHAKHLFGKPLWAPLSNIFTKGKPESSAVGAEVEESQPESPGGEGGNQNERKEKPRWKSPGEFLFVFLDHSL